MADSSRCGGSSRNFLKAEYQWLPIPFADFRYLFSLLLLIFSFMDHAYASSNTAISRNKLDERSIAISKNLGFLDSRKKLKDLRRYRRDSTSICKSLLQTYEKCEETKFWNLQVFKNTTAASAVCNQSKSQSDKVACVQEFYCSSSGCNDVYAKYLDNGCSKEELIKKRKTFLDTLCMSDEKLKTSCIAKIIKFYTDLEKANETKCKVEEFKSNGCKHCYKGLRSSSAGCCFSSLMKIIPSTSEDTFELSPNAWKQCSLKPKLCEVTSTPAVTVKAMTGLPKTPNERQPTPTPSAKTSSSRLIAGGVLAAIIFIVLLIIIGRYMYQRSIRRKSLRYEDYGYTQLQMLEDNLYDDEEDDDDQLLSAT